jgi:hypothetical protein
VSTETVADRCVDPDQDSRVGASLHRMEARFNHRVHAVYEPASQLGAHTDGATSQSTRRTGDYDSPDGTVENSKTRLSSGRAGLGHSGEQVFASGGFTLEDGRYGVPFAGAIHGSGPRHVNGTLSRTAPTDTAASRNR